DEPREALCRAGLSVPEFSPVSRAGRVQPQSAKAAHRNQSLRRGGGQTASEAGRSGKTATPETPESDRGAGVRHDQTSRRLPALDGAGIGASKNAMGGDLHRVQ